MGDKRKIEVSLAVCISANLFATIFDLLTTNGTISTITVDGKITGLGNPAFVMEFIATISVTYACLCILSFGRTKKALGFTALISVIISLAVLGDYVLIHSHRSVYFPILLSLYSLASISPFVAFFIYKFTVDLED